MFRRKFDLPPLTIIEMINRYQAGESLRPIAKDHGMSVRTLARIMKRYVSENNIRLRGAMGMSGPMTREKHLLISSQGGVQAHACGRGHKFTTEQAITAGRKGGLATQQKNNKGNDYTTYETPMAEEQVCQPTGQL